MNLLKVSFFALIAFCFISSDVYASGKTPPRSDGMGTPQCAAYDSGSTEEHAPHLTCESCLSSGHAHCDMKCFSYDYTCKATAQHDEVRLIIDPVTNQKREERQTVTQTYSATAQTKDLARERALHECELQERYRDRNRDHRDRLELGRLGPQSWINSSCQLSSCDENSHTSSSSSCR